MQHPGYIGGATGITMERWSLGIAATWYLIMPPLWLMEIDGGGWNQPSDEPCGESFPRSSSGC